MRAGSTVSCRRSAARSPGSRSRSVRTCQGLGPRRTVRGLALAPSSVLPSAVGNASASGITELSRLNGWPARSPADASPIPSRGPPHGSGPMWFAIPSSQWTLTTYSLPVSRRTPTVPVALFQFYIGILHSSDFVSQIEMPLVAGPGQPPTDDVSPDYSRRRAAYQEGGGCSASP
jgi:hypothetical protein